MKLNIKHYAIAGFLGISAISAVAFRLIRNKAQTMLYPLSVIGRITSPFGDRINPIRVDLPNRTQFATTSL